MAKQNISDVAYWQYEKTFTGSEEDERKKEQSITSSNYMTKCLFKQRLDSIFARFLLVFQVF